MSAFDEISVTLERLRKRDLYRRRRVVDSPLSRVVRVDGRELLNFCSNDYLGLANDPRIAEAYKAGIDRWGTGTGASHLVCGHTAAHHELEEALADFTGRERALLFSSGYSANVGTVNALVSRGDAIFEDRLNHASLLDGGWISRAEFSWYAHADAGDLRRRLEALDEDRQRRLIVTDGTFSMDGDLCPIEDLVALAGRFDAWLMVDDAHGFGVHGTGGRGLVDPARFGTGDVPVLMATLGKAVGTFGAFVAGDETLIEYLVQRARNYIYTTAMPSSVAVATRKSLEIVAAEEWRRERLGELIGRFRSGAEQLGLSVAPSATPIQPVLIGDSGRALAASSALEERGLLITAIRPPTVPQGSARLRITFTAAHEPSDVDRLLQALADVLDNHRVKQ